VRVFQLTFNSFFQIPSDEYANTFFTSQEYGRHTGSNELGKYKFQAWEEDMKRKERHEKLKNRVTSRKKKR